MMIAYLPGYGATRKETELIVKANTATILTVGQKDIDYVKSKGR